ncbi:MAG: hypothetical protein GXP26_03380 [Planctomycetes bacterium]|nr:hypothetical protein [Planctomycetota bacterium]
MTEHDPPLDDDDDDLELELEPIDPEIIEHKRQQTIRQTRKAEDSVDVNETFDEAAASDPFEISDLKQFRFSIRHLLIVTALLSIAMTVYKSTDACNGTLIIFVLTVVTGWWFVVRKERRQQHELQLRKQEMKARIAAQRAAEDGDLATPLPAPAEITFDSPPETPSFRFSFSLKELFGAFTAAALLLGLLSYIGGVQNIALPLGMVALLGLVVHAMGFDPPHLAVLGWWILLVLYILISAMASFSGDQAAVAAPPSPFESVLAQTSGSLLVDPGRHIRFQDIQRHAAAAEYHVVKCPHVEPFA